MTGIEDLETLLLEVYEKEDLLTFLESPQEMLGGLSPQDLVNTGRTDELRRFIMRILDLVYL